MRPKGNGNDPLPLGRAMRDVISRLGRGAPARPPRDPVGPDERLGQAVARALATETALERILALDGAAAAADYDAQERLVVDANREARDVVIGALLGRLDGPAEPVAIVLEDGTIAAYTPDHDGLALVPPGRVYRIAGEGRP